MCENYTWDGGNGLPILMIATAFGMAPVVLPIAVLAAPRATAPVTQGLVLDCGVFAGGGCSRVISFSRAMLAHPEWWSGSNSQGGA